MAIAVRNEGSKVNSNINVTPMVDVMLVLLIIFMVITPMLQKGQSVNMAQVNNPTPMPDADKEDALLVVVMRDGQIFFGTDRIKKSHLAEVVTAGLQEFRASSGTATEETIASSGRALERAEAIVHAKLKRGLAVLATIGSTAPFIGLLGTVVGILNAFKEISTQKATGLGAVAGGISEALVTTAIGLFVAIPAVMMFNYFTGKVEAFDVEMDNSSSELIDYFLKRRSVRR